MTKPTPCRCPALPFPHRPESVAACNAESTSARSYGCADREIYAADCASRQRDCAAVSRSYE